MVYGDREIITKTSQTFRQNKLFLNPSVFWTVEKVMQSFPLKNQNQIKNLTLLTKLQVKNLYEILKKQSNFYKAFPMYYAINYTQEEEEKTRKIWISETAGNDLRIWFLSCSIIFLRTTFYWSCAIPSSSQDFSRTYFWWCLTLPLLERPQRRSSVSCFFNGIPNW